MRSATGQCGFTLMELLVVLVIIGTLAGIVCWGSADMLRHWQSWRGAQQLLEDFKIAQARAENRGGFALSDGGLVTTRSFLVFEPLTHRYLLYDWHDGDGDGRPEDGETWPIWTRELPPGVHFGWDARIDAKACSNQSGAPTAAITFGTASYPPCSGRPCLKFDQQGYSAMGPGAVYLVDGEQSFALTATRPGHVTLCRWDGSEWR